MYFVSIYLLFKTVLDSLFVCLCLTSHRQRGHSETAPPFTVPVLDRQTA